MAPTDENPRAFADPVDMPMTVHQSQTTCRALQPANEPAAVDQRRADQILGSVTPRCFWYLPFLSAYDTSHGSSPWKNSTCAMPSLA